jgi:hypothetical protein
MSHADVGLGLVDYVWRSRSRWGQANLSGEMASEPAALMENNTVRVLDLLLSTKDVDGSVQPLSARPTKRGRQAHQLVVERGTASVMAHEQHSVPMLPFGIHQA